MKYTMNIEKDGDAFLINLPEIPELNAVAYSEETIQSETLDAFELSMDFYTDANKPIPLPRKPVKGAAYLQIPATLAAKIYLYNEWLNSEITKKDLAEKIGVKPPNLNRLFDFRYKSKMEAIEQALSGLGKSFDLRVV